MLKQHKATYVLPLPKPDRIIKNVKKLRMTQQFFDKKISDVFAP
jgi:hypothetical protein